MDNLCFPEYVEENIASANDVPWHKIHSLLLFKSLKNIKLHMPSRILLVGNVSIDFRKGWGKHGEFCDLSILLINSSIGWTFWCSIAEIIFFYSVFRTFWVSVFGSFFDGMLNWRLAEMCESVFAFTCFWFWFWRYSIHAHSLFFLMLSCIRGKIDLSRQLYECYIDMCILIQMSGFRKFCFCAF